MVSSSAVGSGDEKAALGKWSTLKLKRGVHWGTVVSIHSRFGGDIDLEFWPSGGCLCFGCKITDLE